MQYVLVNQNHFFTTFVCPDIFWFPLENWTLKLVTITMALK